MAKNKATVQTAPEGEQAATEQTTPEAFPVAVKLVRPHGFIAEDGASRHWEQGEIVTDADDIALLIERKADIEEVNE